jgi:hypothetical protein
MRAPPHVGDANPDLNPPLAIVGAEGQGIAQIGTTLWLVSFQLGMGSEQMFDDRGDPFMGGRRARRRPDGWTPCPPAIITAALFGIAQDGIGLVEASQARLSVWVFRMQVRVKLRR